MANLVLAPEHLSSLRKICIRFKKSRENVLKWRDEGAPIAFDGLKYCAEYNQLQAWLVERNRKRPKTQKQQILELLETVEIDPEEKNYILADIDYMSSASLSSVLEKLQTMQSEANSFISPKDVSDNAIKARQLASLNDISGFVFPILVDTEINDKGFLHNKLKSIVTIDDPEYSILVEQGEIIK